MIIAGTTEEVIWGSGNWVFLDIGFSNKSRTCGLLFGDGDPKEYSFSDASTKIRDFIKDADSSVNLVIEAPLSVAFDEKGNPKGREPEKRGGKTRYWYELGGCLVMVAATYLLRDLTNLSLETEVRLFEGFVSFKDKATESSHSRDVLALRDTVKCPGEFITEPSKLKIVPSDKLFSAFKVCGMDYGVPPVIHNRD